MLREVFFFLLLECSSSSSSYGLVAIIISPVILCEIRREKKVDLIYIGKGG